MDEEEDGGLTDQVGEQTKTITIAGACERVLEANDEIAAATRSELARRGIFAIDLIGAPGSGKTALLEATLRALAAQGRHRPAVAGRRSGHAARRRPAGPLVRARRPDIHRRGLPSRSRPDPRRPGQLDLDGVDLLFIENVGNLICPVGFDLGQTAKVGLFSLTEGDDKAAKHPVPGHGRGPDPAQQDRPGAAL